MDPYASADDPRMLPIILTPLTSGLIEILWRLLLPKIEPSFAPDSTNLLLITIGCTLGSRRDLTRD
jgi:hypothetical protein